MCSHSHMEKALSGMLPEELFSFMQFDKPFRARQIFKWIAAGAKTFDEMTNLSLADRTGFDGKYSIYSTKVSRTEKDPDGTVKLQISLADGTAVETVLLTDAAGRKTACVSCQVGCPLHCAFCRTGDMGFSRNLSTGEIVEQFLHLEAIAGRLDNIVFMGMGEPMLNLPAIRKTVEILTHPEGRGLSRKRITVSTAGICEGIYSLADEGPDIRLAVSLTAADDGLRSELMPVNKANPLSALKEAVKYYNEKTGRRVTLEIPLLGGINTDRKMAGKLAVFSENLNVHINVIPWNSVPSLPFTSPPSAETTAFVKTLEEYGLNITVRKKRGKKIGGACGQLGISRAPD
ncbi:23S rRNA (adenine(2503)-C(2))-methyltransferase RlmN [Brucepastera parasyntrophica]|uniref:23S rRNA (adenine(2503)-C(2))-methyltransferase RlmN n=1 Tax=Brucepastera parasyntrophica TaxID=2880008 RepID=UPI00210CD3B4|nr:23S rRNA (adenine(2503)-C(2))-methyltransferase RlmN [Brucepastera parasyntrophica]ULQ60083.1 23S rRNA (adenine(2503)-C(2))-methyltransferase RlmN [Brucepastera parasyntrophica]